MFVRTKKGKILKCFKSESMNLPIYYVIGSKTNSYVEHQDVKKTSEDIIDILEAGDYVNGSEVMEADWINEDGEYEEGLAFPMYASDDLNVIENWLPLKNVLIKSIVTSQQFESMQYKVD